MAGTRHRHARQGHAECHPRLAAPEATTEGLQAGQNAIAGARDCRAQQHKLHQPGAEDGDNQEQPARFWLISVASNSATITPISSRFSITGTRAAIA